MAFTTAVFCISAVLVQTISGRCIENSVPNMSGCGGGIASNAWANGIGLAGNGYGAGYSYGNIGNSIYLGNGLESVDTYGGSLLVTSSSPLVPNGLRVISEHSLEGPLSVVGQLPFLGAVALEGAIPAAGAAHVDYGCGSGDVRILETYGTSAGYGTGRGAGVGFGAGAAGVGYGAGTAGRGYGAGAAGLGYGAGAADLGYGAGEAGLEYGAAAAGLGYGAGIAIGNSGCGCSGTY